MTLARVIEFRSTIGRPWTHFEPIRLGAAPAGDGAAAADRHVLLTEGGLPALRLELYGGGGDRASGAGEDATFVGDWLAVGYGPRLFLVSLALPPRRPRELPLRSHFSAFYSLPTERALLVASGADVTRVSARGRVAWTSPPLAAHGVRIERVSGDFVIGAAGHPAHGDARPFRLRLADGVPA